MSFSGRLEELGLGEILQIVSISRQSGILSMCGTGRNGTVIFRSGYVVRATSSANHRSLGEVLIQKGVIDPQTLKKALALQQEHGFRERLGTILVNCFNVPAETIGHIVREQIEQAVFSLFSCREGTFDFVMSDAIETVDSTRMDPLQFMSDQGLNPQFLAMEGRAGCNGATGGGEPAGTGGDGSISVQSVPSGSVDDDRCSRMPLVIVDDDKQTLSAIADTMRNSGFEVQATTRSEDALIIVDGLFRRGVRPAVLIDVIMPKMDGSGVLGGMELLDLLHANFNNAAVIMMTDHRHPESEARISRMGYPLVIKPHRHETGRDELLRGFQAVVTAEVKRTAVAATVTTETGFNLGDEIREEFGDDDGVILSSLPISAGQDLPTEKLIVCDGSGLNSEALLHLLQLASGVFSRAVVFTVKDRVISGAGQFGLALDNSDERVRAIHIPLEVESIFYKPVHACRAASFIPQPTPVDIHFFEQLGGTMPREVFVGPIMDSSRVIGLLYGDNLPESQPLGDTGQLAHFLAQAGSAP